VSDAFTESEIPTEAFTVSDAFTETEIEEFREEEKFSPTEKKDANMIAITVMVAVNLALGVLVFVGNCVRKTRREEAMPEFVEAIPESEE
jgi:hypothetical protein